MFPPQLKPREVPFGRAVSDCVTLRANPKNVHEEATVTVAKRITRAELKFNHGTHACLPETAALLAPPAIHLADAVRDIEKKEKDSASSR